MVESVVTQQKQNQLDERMRVLGVQESDIEEKFILGSGSGGQKINKTASCVYLKHIPTGLEIKCQQDRSRALNRYLARRQLCEKLEEITLGKESARNQEIEKIRRQKRKRSHRSKQRMMDDKHVQADKKQNRREVSL